MTHRGYRIEPLGTFSMYKIMPTGSGQIPFELKGNFTSKAFATQAIDRSLEKLKKGRPKNVKKEGTPSN